MFLVIKTERSASEGCGSGVTVMMDLIDSVLVFTVFSAGYFLPETTEVALSLSAVAQGSSLKPCFLAWLSQNLLSIVLLLLLWLIWILIVFLHIYVNTEARRGGMPFRSHAMASGMLKAQKTGRFSCSISRKEHFSRLSVAWKAVWHFWWWKWKPRWAPRHPDSSGSQLSSISITGGLGDHTGASTLPQTFRFNWDWTWALAFFKSSPGDSDRQPGSKGWEP